jgi:predicted O-methyltransferase YrrM
MSALLHLIKWRLGLAEGEVGTTEAERDCLARHAAGKRRVAEIGVWHGGTSRRLRAAMAPDGMFFAVDPYEKGRLGFSIQRVIAKRELERVPNGGLVWIRQTGYAAAQHPEIQRAAPFDFVFIDAPQIYEVIRRKWEVWSPLIASGGIIALHDSRVSQSAPSFEPDSLRYAQEVVLKDPRFEVIDAVDYTTVLRRKAL